MKSNLFPKGYENRPTTKDSTATTFRSSKRPNRQYFSTKKRNSGLSETSYSSTSPMKNGDVRIKRVSLSPDRRSMYWQNWLLPQEMRKPLILQKPEFGSSSVCSIFSDNNEIYISSNCDDKMQIASLTKIMTAFTVIQICNTYGIKLREIWIPIQKQASMMEGTSANLRNGEQFVALDLLYGLMLPSGNDAGIALAMFFGKFLSFIFTNKHLFDGTDDEGKKMNQFLSQKQFYDSEYHEESIKLFVFEMNKNCQKIGLKNTNFTNPTGLSDPDNYSSAHDITLLISFCLRNHLLRSIFKKKVYICESRNQKMASTRQIEWKNTNRHLFSLKDCIGVKTGITPGAGPCLSTAYRVMGRELIVVVLNSRSLDERYQDSEKIYRSAKAKLQGEHQEAQNREWSSPQKGKMELSPQKIELPICK